MSRKASVDANIPVETLLDLVEKESSKKFRNHTPQRLSEYRKDIPKLWYSTGVPTLDIALGGGLAAGRVSEWFGEPNSGKSTILYSAIAENQQRFPDRINIIADPENSSTDAKKHMELLGVDTSKVIVIAPREGIPMYAQDIFERIEFYLRNPSLKDRIAIIGIDSIGALVDRDEGEKDDKWSKAERVGGISGILSRFLKVVVDNGLLQNNGAHLFCLNQVRDNIGMDAMFNPYRTPGGNKLNHVAAQRIEVSRTLSDFKNPNYTTRNYNSGEAQFLGQRIIFKQEKSKVGGKKGATASVDFYYDTGLDIVTNIIQVGILYGVVHANGAWYSLIDTATGEIVEKFQGMERFKQALIENPDLYGKFDYLVNCAIRDIEPLSVIEDWDKIVALDEEGGEDNGEDIDNS